MLCHVLNFHSFWDLFRAYRRDKQFSYYGFQALFDHLEEIYEDSFLEVDVIGLCCDFSQFSSEVDLLNEYPHPKGIEGLREETTVLDVEGGGYIIENF